MTQRQYKHDVWIGKDFIEGMLPVWTKLCEEADAEYKRTHNESSFWEDAIKKYVEEEQTE